MFFKAFYQLDFVNFMSLRSNKFYNFVILIHFQDLILEEIHDHKNRFEKNGVPFTEP